MVVEGGCDIFAPVWILVGAGLGLLIGIAYQQGAITDWDVVSIGVIAATAAIVLTLKSRRNA